MTGQPDLQGRIRVPADLDAVTAVGDEDHSEIDPAAVDRIWQAARYWYQAGHASGDPAVPASQRQGRAQPRDRARLGQRARRPTGRREGPGHRPIRRSASTRPPRRSPRPSCTCWSNADSSPSTTASATYLPGYTSHGKDRTTIRHVLTHSAGVPFPTGPRPDLKRADDHEYAQEQLGKLRPVYRPGLVHIYHALTWGPLMREIVYAATGKDIREILATEILDPLGFRWTNFGVAEAGRPAGRTQPRHRQATARPDRGVVPQGDRRHGSPDHPGHQHAAVPHHRRSRRRTPSRTPTRCRDSPKSGAAEANSTASG